MTEHQTHHHPEDWDEPVEIPEVRGDLERIVVAFDGSDNSERALAYAERVAQMSSAEIIVVTAYDPPITVRRRGILLVEQAQREMEEDATELASEATQLLVGRGNRARALVVRGDTTEAILDAVEHEDADLVVIGRRSHTGLRGRVLGSTSEQVARHAECPVLLVS
jgi:nucleotide-binding universal stress UspA family protein